MNTEKLTQQTAGKSSDIMLAATPEFLQNAESLDTATVSAVDLVVEYWSPENAGDKRRCFFYGFRNETVMSPDNGNEIDLLTAVFVRRENGNNVFFKNSSRRLTGVLESLNIAQGTPLEITYLGKKRNKTNAFTSDTWSIRPLIIK